MANESVFDVTADFVTDELQSFGAAIEDLHVSSQEWRRLCSELLGTFVWCWWPRAAG